MSAQKCDKSKSGYLAGDEIEHFYNLLTHREEINVIYGEYAKTTGFMSPENLVEFLMKEQREKAALADANNIIENFEPDENGKCATGRCFFFFFFFFSLSRPRPPSLCPYSQGEEAAVQRWLPHVLAPSRNDDPQRRAQGGVSGHEPPPQSLLHLLLTQHLSDEGSAQRAQQHGGLRQVNVLLLGPQPSFPLHPDLPLKPGGHGTFPSGLVTLQQKNRLCLWVSLCDRLVSGLC